MLNSTAILGAIENQGQSTLLGALQYLIDYFLPGPVGATRNEPPDVQDEPEARKISSSPGRSCIQRFICELQSFNLNDNQLMAPLVRTLFT